jgi:uncharacterized protein YyaL (SSP411 family)
MDSDHQISGKKPNRLSYEKSPYLLQHAENPVDWYPWGEEAFRKARAEDKPMFLSIGYSTCHWCHVMAHESFEDEEVARVLNEHFVSIKVDREERPDIDAVYMNVCQAVTLRGGWPLSIFMNPDAKAFYAGTYFPKTGRMGMLGFVDVLVQIAAAWKNDRQRLIEVSEKITRGIQPRAGHDAGPRLDLDTLGKGYDQLLQAFDSQWGGFGSAPKFPTPHNLTFLLRWYRRSGDRGALKIVERTLEAMRHGGIYDQIGFGFHRYSVDEKWLVPHFEKMLYDQALLAMAYTEAYQVTGKESYARVVREILTYVLRDMTDAEGGFYTGEDADSEGTEGLFYVWTPAQVRDILGKERAELFCKFYDIGPHGNFEEGRSIAHISLSIEEFAAREKAEPRELEHLLGEARERLFEAREERTHPLKDDKVLTSWNGLMIAAMAKAYQALGDRSFVEAARRGADFILDRLKAPGPRLYRRYRQGEVAIPGYADDYAFLVWGLLELYEATLDRRYLEEATELNRVMLELFWDDDHGGVFFTGREHEGLIARNKEIYDGAVPSSNSVAALNLIRLGRMTGSPGLTEKATEVATAFSKRIKAYPSAYTQFLSALEFMVGPSNEIVIVGDLGRERARAMVHAVHRAFLPNKVLLSKRNGEPDGSVDRLAPQVKGPAQADTSPAVYLCRDAVCGRALTTVSELLAALSEAGAVTGITEAQAG